MKRWKKIVIGFGIFIALLGIAGWIIYGGGKHEGPGVIKGEAAPPATVADKATRQHSVSARAKSKQILFGDLHVHTTFSADAFARSLPFLNGEGAHPPADACDFARYCSSLDFFALTDHGESLTPRHWNEAKESIRQCNAKAGDPKNPDLVAYIGWEWSHVGRVPEEHYGHKNVIFKDTADDKLPTRPIAAGGVAADALKADPGLPWYTLAAIPIREFSRRQRYLDLVTYQRELRALSRCPTGVDTRKLPAGCMELADTPAELFEKLGQWGFESLVIPHGTTWGFYTPPGYTWDKQLKRAQHDPNRQGLIEVYSGHGNSEEYRPWRAITVDDEGNGVCPAPTESYEPCCWRAGEIIRERCGDIGAAECETRVAKARLDYANMGIGGKLSVPGATAADWKGCGQCLDCFNPSFNYRPAGSAQYILARGNFDDPNQPNHARFGFIGSSDNHTARPGTGYKEYKRPMMSEAAGPRSKAWRDRIFGGPGKATETSRRLTQEQLTGMPPFRVLELERQASFFMTGGLVAVHSAGRDRDSIWTALQSKEVYATSGPRILLWFDLVEPSGGTKPMGSEVTASAPPKFRAKAAGAYVQKPGCPDWTGTLGEARLERLCRGECYNPGDERHRIVRIEVVRIRPQTSDTEDIASLIQDPWKTIDCPTSADACTVEFEDPDFATGKRNAIYYVRAIQESTPAVNAGGLRCSGKRCSEVKPCYGDWRVSQDEDCLSPNNERAWSSPIYVDYEAPPLAPADPKKGGTP